MVAIFIAILLVLVGGTALVAKKINSHKTEEVGKEVVVQHNQGTMIEMASNTISVALSAQNNSGESGMAEVSEVDGRAKVVITLSGELQGVAQPAHIHVGSCPGPGAVKYPLSNVVNGVSETVLDVPFSALKNFAALSINIHKSAAEIKTYVACGDFPHAIMNATSSMMKDNSKNGGMMQGEAQKFQLIGKNYSFSPLEIRVKKGTKVKVELNVAEGFHDFVVDEFNARTSRAGAGESVTVEFVADKAGTFEYYCSVGSHRALGMKGKLIVE